MISKRRRLPGGAPEGRRLFAAVIAAFAMPVLFVAPARAAVIQVDCTGTSTVNFSPGLTNTEQSVQVNGSEDASVCVSATHPGLTSFTGSFHATTTRSCLSLLEEGSGTQTLKWNDSTTSFWSFTSHPTQVENLLIIVTTGPITSGTLAGATVTQEQVASSSDLNACNEPGGLKKLSGPSTWQFTSL